MTEPLSDRRAAATAGALIAGVVLVLGFGSGIGTVLSRSGGRSTAAPAAGQDRGTVVQDGIARPVAASATGRGAQVTTPASHRTYDSASTPAAVDHESMSTAEAAAVPEPGASVADPSPTPSPTPAPCTGSSLTTAMVEPFVMHFDKAHLETSPGQQAHDALNVDSYVKTHTVLVESMLAPAVEASTASLKGAQPFWMHFTTAHLETSPGDQVAAALNVDQYTKTHTVLIENMASPAMHDVTDYGCP